MNYQMGGTDCYQAFGISYWNGEDSEKLKADLQRVYNMRGGKENLWEQVPLKIAKKKITNWRSVSAISRILLRLITSSN